MWVLGCVGARRNILYLTILLFYDLFDSWASPVPFHDVGQGHAMFVQQARQGKHEVSSSITVRSDVNHAVLDNGFVVED